MLKSAAALTACIATLALAWPAAAQPLATDDKAQAAMLSQCLLAKTTSPDRLALAKWMVGAMTSLPQLRDIAALDPAKKDGADRAMARLVTRLITVDCAKESRTIMKQGSNTSIQVAFEALGNIAMNEVLNNREAEQALGSYAKYLDVTAFEKLSR